MTIKSLRINSANEKVIRWWPENLKRELKENWPESLRKQVGFQLGRVQQGLEPNNYRTMPIIGSGIREIKLQDEDKSQYRLIYAANFDEAVYVFHVITKKKAEKTNRNDIEIARKRFSEIVAYRKSELTK
jgi:phage-related protein